MPVVSTTMDPQSNEKLLVFDKTPLMSTYLVAFIVGDFEYVEAMTKGNVQMRVYTPLGKASKAQFALDVGGPNQKSKKIKKIKTPDLTLFRNTVKCLDYYTEYFNISYPLPKMDMIAIPDFAAGAMENWGLGTRCNEGFMEIY